MVWIIYEIETGFILSVHDTEPTPGAGEAKVEVDWLYIPEQPIEFWKYVDPDVIPCTEHEIKIRQLDMPGATTLERYKAEKNIEIDEKSGELISLGYTFAGNQFSLSANGQTNILALDATRDDPALTYPIEYNTLDDQGTFSIPNAATLHGMFLTALATKKASLDSGTLLKDQVRAATTIAEVEAVIDNR